MDSKFAEEMATMEANERWEKSITLVPGEVRPDYELLLSSYSTFLKIKLFKFLDLMSWDLDSCRHLLRILHIARDCLDPSQEGSRVDWYFDKLMSYQAAGYMESIFFFFSRLHNKVIDELFRLTTDENLSKVVELARFLPPLELDLMVRFVYELSIVEVLDILEECDEPWVNACRLCRLRRISNLELRMRHDQIPNKMIRVTGALPIYDKAEVWTADDEKSFTFDSESGDVYWQNSLVDLMRICEKCLVDCHGAVTSDGRFDQLYNIQAENRKDAVQRVRNKEQKLSIVVGNISMERVRRRVKEWAMRSLSKQRLGRKKEEEAKDRAAIQQENERIKIKKERDHNTMITKAGVVDPKWREENRTREHKDLRSREHMANLNYLMDYSRSNPATIAREHTHSWGNTNYLVDGTPISKEGALERFGTYSILPNTQLQQLKDWKKNALESHEAYLKRVSDYKARQREAEIEEFSMRKEYVDKRLKRLQRDKELLGRTLELEEQARQDKRKADRAARAAIRFAKMEAEERCAMEIEDDVSGRSRFYEWECQQINREREGLWFEENEQRSIDNFWGLELESQRLESIRQKYVDFYDSRTSHLREQLIFTKQIRPFVIEAARKEYKNPFTGEFLK